MINYHFKSVSAKDDSTKTNLAVSLTKFCQAIHDGSNIGWMIQTILQDECPSLTVAIDWMQSTENQVQLLIPLHTMELYHHSGNLDQPVRISSQIAVSPIANKKPAKPVVLIHLAVTS